MGYFTRGPADDFGVADLTDLLKRDGLDERVVQSRFSLWSARGRVYGLPRDVHPVMLAYRRDLVAELGIDVSQLDTWDKFVEVGRRFADNDLAGARAAWAPLASFVPLLFAEANPMPIKYLLWRQGLIASPECRLPLTKISDALARRLDAALTPAPSAGRGSRSAAPGPSWAAPAAVAPAPPA